MSLLGFANYRLRKIDSVQFVRLLFYLSVVSKKSGKGEEVGDLVMTPSGRQQVVQEGANLTLTCTYDHEGNISWTLPDNLAKYPVGYSNLDFTIVFPQKNCSFPLTYFPILPSFILLLLLFLLVSLTF